MLVVVSQCKNAEKYRKKSKSENTKRTEKNQPTNNNADKHSYLPESDYTYSLRKFNKTKMSCVERNRKIKIVAMHIQPANNKLTPNKSTKDSKWINIMPISIFIYAHIYSFIPFLVGICTETARFAITWRSAYVCFFHSCSIDFSFVWLHNFGYVVYRVWFFFFPRLPPIGLATQLKFNSVIFWCVFFLVNRIC